MQRGRLKMDLVPSDPRRRHRIQTSLDEYENPGEATVYVLQGRVTLDVGEDRGNGSPVISCSSRTHDMPSRLSRTRWCARTVR
jgi:hypothetical protein